MIARLLGLLLLLVAALPAAADVRAQSVVQAAQGATHTIAKWGHVPGPGRLFGSPKSYDENERDAPAFGYADVDDPEPEAAPVARDRFPPQRVAATLPCGRRAAPPRHRACAAPPRGPPAV